MKNALIFFDDAFNNSIKFFLAIHSVIPKRGRLQVAPNLATNRDDHKVMYAICNCSSISMDTYLYMF